jgi:invasion protein IalB
MRGIFLSLSLVTAFGLSAPTPLLAQDAAATPDAAVAPAKKAKPVIKKPAGNAPATAAAPDVVAQQFGNWQVGCPKAAKGKEKCAARMVVSDTKRKVALLTWVFGYNQKGEMLSEILSPMDVYIGPGAVVALDGKAVLQQTYVQCGPSGCLSRAVVTKQFLTGLKASTKASVTIAATSGKNIAFGMGTDGLADALKALGQ